MEKLSQLLIIIFFIGAVFLQLWSKYRTTKNQKQWREDFDKYQNNYRKNTSLDGAIDESNKRFGTGHKED